MLGKNFAAVFLVLAACNSKQVVEDTQCSEAEQAMFLSCVSAGCSASYTQDLSGTDACAVEGGGSIVSVEAGGECGFTSSGSCYVVCDCPEGASLNAESESESETTTEEENNSIQNDLSYSLQAILERIRILEETIVSLQNSQAAIEEECQNQITSFQEVSATLNERLTAIEEEAIYTTGLIASEWEVDCAAQDPIPYYYYDGSVTFETGWCLIAVIDINDPPYSITVGAITEWNQNGEYWHEYSRADSISRWGSDRPDLYDGYINWGNDWRYGFSFYEERYLIREDGSVLSSLHLGIDSRRVVILDDKPYTQP
jgi:hypothetical protein